MFKAMMIISFILSYMLFAGASYATDKDMIDQDLKPDTELMDKDLKQDTDTDMIDKDM